MGRKTNLWSFIFLLLIGYTLASTVDISPVISTLDVSAVDSTNFPLEITVTADHQMERPPGETYQEFNIQFLENDVIPDKLYFSVSKTWLQYKKITAEDIILYIYKDGQWNPLSTKKRMSFATTQSFSVNHPVEGHYAIVNQGKKTASSGFFWYVLGLILIGSFIVYWVNGHKATIRHKDDMELQNLEKYLRQSLVKGHQEKDIRAALANAGWDPLDIDQGFRRVRLL